VYFSFIVFQMKSFLKEDAEEDNTTDSQANNTATSSTSKEPVMDRNLQTYLPTKVSITYNEFAMEVIRQSDEMGRMLEKVLVTNLKS
jgi:hypothetical protein